MTEPEDEPAGQPMPYPYQYQPYPQYPQYRPAPPVNTYAILAVILAFVAFPPLGIYFGRKAREQIEQTGERGIELAKVGIVAGWILSCFYGLFVIVWCGFAGSLVFSGLSGS